MKRYLKQILPLEWNYYLKHFFEFLQNKTPYFSKSIKVSDKKIYFLDCPAYGNLGDQAIALAMRKFMQEVLPEYLQYEITEDKLPIYFKWLKENINKEDIICLTGGGNMGVDYQRYEAVRRIVLKHFSQNTIIIFPQTYDYGTSNYGRRERKRAIKTYNQIPKLLLCAREEKSYNLMQKDFPKVKVILCPDIVLYLDYLSISKSRGNIGVCLRVDKERILTLEQKKYILKKFPDYKNFSTLLPLQDITEKTRENIIKNYLEQISSLKLFITDRLHGMIFAFITNTPCIAFSNTNGKVKNVFEKWLENKGTTVFANDINNLPEIEKNKTNKTNQLPKEYFKELKKYIQEYVNNNR